MPGETYTLRFPFTTAPGQEIELDPPCSKFVGPYQWTLSREPPAYVLFVHRLASDAECREYSRSIWGAFKWVQLTRGFPITAQSEYQSVAYSKDSQTAARELGRPELGGIDVSNGVASGDDPIGYPSSRCPVLIMGGDVHLTHSAPANQILNVASEGLAIRSKLRSRFNDKFHTALELHAAFWHESSPKAKFLTLMLALESLLPRTPRHVVVREAIDEWHPTLKARRDCWPPGSDEFTALDALINEVIYKRTDSLGVQIRFLIKRSLSEVDDSRGDEFAARSRGIYKARSTLVHDGHLPKSELDAATDGAKEIVEAVLQAIYQSQ